MEHLDLSRYADVSYDKSRGFIIIRLNSKASELLPDEGFEELKRIYDNILPLKPEYVMINLYDLLFPFTPAFMNRVANELFPVILQAGTIKRTAYVVSPDITTKIGLELLNRKLYSFGDQIKRRIFESEQEAEEWLFR